MDIGKMADGAEIYDNSTHSSNERTKLCRVRQTIMIICYNSFFSQMIQRFVILRVFFLGLSGEFMKVKF